MQLRYPSNKLEGGMEAGKPASMRLVKRRKMDAIFSHRVDHIAGVLRLMMGRVAFLSFVPFSQLFYRDEDG